MITVEGLTKYYGEKTAIRDLSFEIDRGQVIGFLGLNGAGKSTTLKVLGCVLLPTSGSVTIDGFDVLVDPHEIRKRIGYLPDTPPLYEEMTVRGYLAFVAQLRGVESVDVGRRVDEAVERTALKSYVDAPISALSHGYRQRVGVAQALVHKPRLLILDEPTSGLDPEQIVEMRELVRGLKGEHTVLVSSHILSEISAVCDRLLVIHEGTIVAQGSEDELARALGGGEVIELEVRGVAAEKAIAAMKAVEGVRGVELTRLDGELVALRLDAPPALRPLVVRTAVQAGFEVLKVDRGQGRLENIFLKLTRAKEA
jgi:ABC-2 type transport system ATP-binding protein